MYPVDLGLHDPWDMGWHKVWIEVLLSSVSCTCQFLLSLGMGCPTAFGIAGTLPVASKSLCVLALLAELVGLLSLVRAAATAVVQLPCLVHAHRPLQ